VRITSISIQSILKNASDNESRNSAIANASPIQPGIRSLLSGYIDDAVLNRALYKIGDNGVANLAQLVQRIGDAAAVTLNDVIVFHRPEDAANPGIWAHELKHVEQYWGKGVLQFANEYVTNSRTIEDPAYAVEANYWAWAEDQPYRPAPLGFSALPDGTLPPFLNQAPSNDGPQGFHPSGPPPGLGRPQWY
jgi:hypothetical protein